MTKYFDSRPKGNFGIARFTTEISKRLKILNPYHGAGNPFSPFDPLVLSLTLPLDTKFFVSASFTAPIFRKIPYAICIHDLIQLDMPEYFNFYKVLYFKTIVKYIAYKSNKIFTVSEFTKSRIIFHYKISQDKIVVLGNGSSSNFHPRGPEYISDFNYDYIFNYSSKKIHKNINNLIKAFLNIKNTKDIKLIISGDCNKFEIDQGLPCENIIFIGELSDKRLINLIQGAKAVIFPSLYEGFGIPIIESYACGTPVITSNTSSMAEISNGVAFLCDPHSIESIANAINELLTTSSADVRLNSNELIEISKKYSWDKYSSLIDNYANNF